MSGRPAELPGVEQMLGLFINTLPVRVRLNPEESLAALLIGIQESQSRLLAFQHVRLVEIKQQAKCGELFDTLMVFENYPLDNAARTEPVAGLRLTSIQGRDVTHYPLSLKVVPWERLRLRLDYDPVRFEREQPSPSRRSFCACSKRPWRYLTRLSIDWKPYSPGEASDS